MPQFEDRTVWRGGESGTARGRGPLDVELALERLTKALPLQLRSAAAYTDLDDVRRLVEKIVTLGGEPVKEISGHGLPKQGDAIVKRLIELEQEQVDTLLRAQRG